MSRFVFSLRYVSQKITDLVAFHHENCLNEETDVITAILL